MGAADLDERRLIAKAAGGDVAAFERLYRLHAGRVYGLCVRLTDSQAEAQDCTQETFVKAWRSLTSFRGDSGLGTWLHRIAVNEVIGRKRKHAKEAQQLSLVESYEDPPAPDSTTADDLEGAIGRLPDRARQALVLQKIYGYTHEEAAQMMGIAVGTCKVQVHRAVKLLASMLSEQPAAAEPAPDGAAERS